MPPVTPYYSKREVFGPFHRLRSTTQDAETMVAQLLSGEAWGRPPSWGGAPAVKAYAGALREGQSGFEFWSFQAPIRPQGPVVNWSIEGPYVTIDAEDQMAKLSVAFIRLTKDVIEALK